MEMLHKARNGVLPESSQKLEDYSENKIESDNLGKFFIFFKYNSFWNIDFVDLGFKLLQKMGWKEGKGIGANEQLQSLVNK